MSREARALGVATLSITLGAIPVFLLGALAVFIRDELQLSEFTLGLVASAYYSSSAIASVPGGRLAERLGGRHAVGVAAVLTGASMLGVAVIGRSWATLLACLVVAGIANGIALPASNLVLAREVSIRRQGLAFGVKQSSGPIASLFAGAAVPVIGLTIGWRWAFVVVAAAALPIMKGHGRPTDAPVRREKEVGSVPVGPLVALAFGAAAAVVGGSSLATFYVQSAVAEGVSAGSAGILLAAGSVLGISVRIGWGAVAGRWHQAHIPMLGALLSLGALGFFMLGQASSLRSIALVTVLTFATGWGWPAIYNFAIVVRTPAAPAAATGIAATGLYSGGIIGPVVFGAIVEASGYTAAWRFVAACVAVGAVCIYAGGRSLERRTVRN